MTAEIDAAKILESAKKTLQYCRDKMNSSPHETIVEWQIQAVVWTNFVNELTDWKAKYGN